MTEHMQDYLALLQEMIVIKKQISTSLRFARWYGLETSNRLADEIAILEEKKIEVESFIKSGPKTYGEKTQ